MRSSISWASSAYSNKCLLRTLAPDPVQSNPRICEGFFVIGALSSAHFQPAVSCSSTVVTERLLIYRTLFHERSPEPEPLLSSGSWPEVISGSKGGDLER